MIRLCLTVCFCTWAVVANAQPADDAELSKSLTALRQELLDSFIKGDVDRLLSHVTDDVVVTWQNAEVCHGPKEVRAYYDRMMTGPNKVVAAVKANPQISGRQMHGDWGVSWGLMNDHFTLTDGSDLAMNSHFTATIIRKGDAWKISAIHFSTNAFENSILKLAISKTARMTAILAGLVALVLGIFVGRFTKR